jgi:hypothetical protein
MRLLRLMAIFLLLLTPLRMMAGGPAMASPHAMTVTIDLGHCESQGKDQKGQPRFHSHCSMAAPGIPLGGGEILAQPIVPAPAQPLALATSLRGLDPEATTPPPRLS